jgi:hypothetical protein
LFRDRWKLGARPAPAEAAPARPSANGADSRARSAVYSRHSHGLEEFFRCLEGETGLSILDLAGASQANVNFITNFGHRLYSEDLYQILEAYFGQGDFYANQNDAERAERFLAHSLSFPDASFDGALLWDMLEYLAPALLQAAVTRLERIMKPGAYLLAIFHADEKAESVPVYFYRIAGAGTLMLTLRGLRRPAQFFNNRAIEKLFRSFRSVKFFLTRDHLREVIVRR